MPVFRGFARVLLILILAAGASGCGNAERKMILKVDRFMAEERWEQALDYLEGYLSKHNKSLTGWRYRVLIRLEQGQRASAASEYAALSDALQKHEPAVLREVVLGAGGRWLLSDYRALARCVPKGVVDASFFGELLEAKALGSAGFAKVATPTEETAAVIDALPGRLPPAETWPLVVGKSDSSVPTMAARRVKAAGRHLAIGGLDDLARGQARDIILDAAGSSAELVREAALLAAVGLPTATGGPAFVALVVDRLSSAGDVGRSAATFLLGAGSEARGPGAWSDQQLVAWAETGPAVLGVLAVAEQQARAPSAVHSRVLDRRRLDGGPAERLAAVAQSMDGEESEAVWKSLSLSEQRNWGPVFVRSGAPSRGLWAARVLGAADAVLVQAAASALALPGWGNDSRVDPHLIAALSQIDPSTRAAAAGSLVRRGADEAASTLRDVFVQGHDRVMAEMLGAMVEAPSASWSDCAQEGLRSDVPLIRERSVDALVAGCEPRRADLLRSLLDDRDPHVAIRAASALYMQVGAGDGS